MTIIFTRHGESVNNVPGSVWVPDPDLTPRGLEQAKLLARRLGDLRIDAIVSSPLVRALRTANEISLRKGGMPVHVYHELVEVGTDYQVISHTRALEFCPAALPYEDTSGGGDYGDGWNLYIKDPHYLFSRACRVFSRVRQTFSEDAAVVLVGHVGINQQLIPAALRLSLPPGLKLAQDNTCVNVVEYRADGVTQLITMNDTSHLTKAEGGSL